MTHLKKATLAALGLLAIAGATPAAAAWEVNLSSGKTIQGYGLAVHGYDPVAYFTEGAPVLGSAKFSTVHEEATYRFANQENLDRFKRDPAKYVPEYGGYCAYGVSVGAKFDGDPHYWKIVDGRLYLNLNEDIQNTWQKDVPGNIAKAETVWTKIQHKAPSEL